MNQSDEIADAPAKEQIRVIGFGRRLVAALIDGFLLLFFSTMLAFLVMILFTFVSIFSSNPPTFSTLLVVAGLILSVVYYVGFWSKSGQTVGNGLTSIQVVGANGESVSWGKGLLRYIGYIISGAVASIGFLWIEFNANRRGWHDIIADTYVISENDAFSNVKDVELVPSDQGKGWIWIVIWVVIAIAAPAALFSGLLILGPFVDKIMKDLLSGLVG